MTKINSDGILSLAQQGNPEAIARLLNQSLGSQGIRVRVIRLNQKLTFFIDAQNSPDQASTVSLISRGIRDLNSDAIQNIKICGRRQGSGSVEWQQEISLGSFALASHGSLPTDYLKKLRQFRPNRRMVMIAASSFAVILVSYLGYSGLTLLQTRSAQAEAIKKAKTLVAEANIDQVQGSESLRMASTKLKQARDLLRSIPEAPLSLYADAQDELNKVRTQIEQIDRKVDAEQTATSNFEAATELARQAMASVRSQPKPLQTWQKAKEDLEKAIAQLKSIPGETSHFAKAQEQLEQYQKQLKSIDQGVISETQAMQVLAQAENLARQAMSHTPSSTYRFDLQELQASQPLWNQAIAQIRKVPPASHANLAAQEQLAVYAHNVKEIADSIQEIQECNARTSSSSFLTDFCSRPFVSLRDPEFVATARPDES